MVKPISNGREDGQEVSPLGLYVHVPFCSAICNYCNFNPGLFDEALKTRYVDALVREIGRAGRAVEAAVAGERLGCSTSCCCAGVRPPPGPRAVAARPPWVPRPRCI